ncbi:MAG: hypothetical protein EZS28_013610 [Streblomastix strix]|uniref:Uncharacterized protein n=1 Tax=Streblomastix strix TaxID=222440 RepID=A0A5J4W7J0_9EUKA|nr:MAG: hypothetical protein EZS28_013610 [Streblomastix strix]
MLFSSDNIKWAYQFQFEHEQQKFVKPIVKHSANVMIWASMSRKRAGSVYFVDGTMESGQHIRILAEWQKVGHEYCETQVISIPRSIDELKKAKGVYTSY